MCFLFSFKRLGDRRNVLFNQLSTYEYDSSVQREVVHKTPDVQPKGTVITD